MKERKSKDYKRGWNDSRLAVLKEIDELLNHLMFDPLVMEDIIKLVKKGMIIF